MNRITKTKLYALLRISLKNPEDKSALQILINDVSMDEICKILSSTTDTESATFVTGLKNAVSGLKGEISNPLISMLCTPAEEDIEDLNSAKDVIAYYIERGKLHYLATNIKQNHVLTFNKD